MSSDSAELETVMLWNTLIVSKPLFEDMCGTGFGVIPNMNETWPDDFNVILDEAKVVMAEPSTKLTYFWPLYLCFENHILDHIIATTVLPRKGSLRNISNRDVFALYCLLKKYII